MPRQSYYYDKCGKAKTRRKENIYNSYIMYQLCRTQAMFEYKNLPETISAKMLEVYLQMNGFAVFTEHENELYFYSEGVGLGGVPDVYYRPTIATIANPAQHFSATLEIGKDCEIMLNDSYLMGLMPMFARYSDLLTENTITMRVANVNMRKVSLMSAPDDRTREAAEKYQRDIENGDTYIPVENEFLGGIHVQPLAVNGANRNMTELIEYQQYLLGGWYNEIGIDSAFNMKRERLSEAESDQNIESTIPFAIDMLNNRKEAIDRINKRYGTNITVDFSSVWRGLDDVTSGEDESEEVNEQQ